MVANSACDCPLVESAMPCMTAHLLRHDLQCLEVVLQISPTCTHTGILPLISQISGNPSQLVLRCKTGHPVVWKGREGVVEVMVVVLLSTLGCL